MDKKDVWFLGAMGRLKSGVTLDQARAQLAAISAPIFQATLPAYRRQGIASGLIRRLVRRGRERGCTTTSLVASRAGTPVYERLGYRDLGHVHMWERPAR